jgi:DNA-directed RNA polymerase II subunit RPB2
MNGVCLSNIDNTLEQKLFEQLCAATVDAHFKATKPATHIIEAYDRFLADIPRLINQIGSYAIVDKDKDGYPVVVVWYLVYKGTWGVDLHPSDLTDEENKALCLRSKLGCTPECLEEGHQFELYTPNGTRVRRKKSYMVPIITTVKREVYRTKRTVRRIDSDGQTVLSPVDIDQVEALEKVLYKAYQKSGDSRGRYLQALIQSAAHPLFALLERKEEFCGDQSPGIIRIPRLVGSKGCVMSKELRQGVVDEELRVIRPPYNMADYARLKEDPDDTGGYLLIEGREYIVRLTNRGATNQFQTTVSQKGRDAPKIYKTSIRVHTQDMDPLDVETAYCLFGRPNAKSFPIPVRNIDMRIPENIRNKMETQYTILLFGASWMRQTIPMSIVMYALGVTNANEMLTLMGSLHVENVADENDTYGCIRDTLVVGTFLALQEMPETEGLSHKDRIIAGARSVMVRAFRTNKHEREKHASLKKRITFFENRVIEFIMRQVRHRNALSKSAVCMKASALSHMCIRTACCMAGLTQPDDIDHMGNQRLYGVYEYMSHLLLTTVRQTMAFRTDLALRHYLANQFNIYNETVLSYPADGWNFNASTNRFLYAIKTGTVKHNEHKFTGITACVNRLSRFAAMASSQNVSSTIDDKSKTVKPRQVHSTHFGVICPADTSEGQRCGLNKHLSASARVSAKLSKQNAKELNRLIFSTDAEIRVADKHAEDPFAILIDQTSNRNTFPIMINGVLWGFTSNAFGLCARINDWRNSDMSRIGVAAVFLRWLKIVEIRTGFGRLMRPLFRVVASPNNSHAFYIPTSKAIMHALNASRLERSRITVEDLFAAGTITFADVLHQENMLIGMSPRQLLEHDPRTFLTKHPITHFEIEPALMYGLRGSLLPYANHNQSPRLTYYIQMKSAAVGVPMLNKLDSNETTIYELCYPQRSLTFTSTTTHTGMYDNPDGQQVLVAIMCFTGYNQEDSIIINQSACDLGFGKVMVYKRFELSEGRSNGQIGPGHPPLGEVIGDVVLANPVDCCDDVRPASTWPWMDQSGLLEKGTQINSGDPLIGGYKVVPQEVDDGPNRTKIVNVKVPFCVYYKGDSAASVERVRVDIDNDGLKRAVVHVSFMRGLTVGDKLAEPFQKNTVGMMFRQEDMPFIVGPPGLDGMTVTAVMNPHAFPSRMTLSPLIEALASWSCLDMGMAANGTAFREHGTDRNEKNNLFDRCKQMGISPIGAFPMMNPFTGKMLLGANGRPAQVTVGFTDVHRLKHMVVDKIQSASNATIDIITQQPVAGKRRGGAIRFGEMERDCAIAHGAASFLHDTLYNRSDPYAMEVCTICNRFAFKRKYEQQGRCTNVDCRRTKNADTERFRLPFAAKLFFQELTAMGISVRFFGESDKPDDDGVASPTFKLTELLDKMGLTDDPPAKLPLSGREKLEQYIATTMETTVSPRR